MSIAKSNKASYVDDAMAERLKPWPSTKWRAVLITLMYAAPLLIITFLNAAMGSFLPNSANPNAVLMANAIHFSKTGGVAGLFLMFPSVSLGIAGLASLAGSAGLLVLGIFGSLVSAVLLVEISELLRQKKISLSVRILLMATLLANPVIYYNTLFDISELLAIAFFGLALMHMIRFAQWGSTYSGFIAGLLFAASILTRFDSITLVAVAIFSLFGFRLIYRGHKGSIAGIITVLLYPTALAIVTIAVISFALHHDITYFLQPMLHPVNTDYLTDKLNPNYSPYLNVPLVQNFHVVNLNGFSVITLFLPVLFLLGTTNNLKARLWAFASGIILVIAQIFINTPNTYLMPAGGLFLLMTTLGIVLAAEKRNKIQLGFLVGSAIVEIIIGWVVALTRPETVTLWIHTSLVFLHLA